MTRQDADRTPAIRAWLAAGSEELSPRVLEGVLREVPAMSQDRPHWAGPRLGMSSFALGAAVGAAAAGALAVAIISAGLFGGVRPGGARATPTSTPAAPSPSPVEIDYSYRRVGFIGLPPRGAAPSDPIETELVETFWRPGPPYKGAAFLYADGRLIWNEYYDDDQSRSTGWLELSLTDEGIDLVRALDLMSLADGTRLLKPEELMGRLPDDAWVDKAVRPYIPSGFAACVFVLDQENPFTESTMTLSQKLAELPPDAGDLLHDRPLVPSDADDSGTYENQCMQLDVREARRLEAILRTVGFEQDQGLNRYLLEYHTILDVPEAGTWWLSIWFEPILPDGTITCSGCG